MKIEFPVLPARRLLVVALISLLATAVLAVEPRSSDIQDADSDDAKQLVKRAERAVRRGDLAEAEKLAKRALELSPANTAGKLTLAYIYVKQRKLLAAYEMSFAVARDEPSNARAFAVLGVTLLSGGRFSDAKAILNTAVKNDRTEALAWAGLGMLNFYENKLPDSIDYLREAVYYEPRDADYHFALAQVSARAEQYKQAADAYYRFLAVSKNTDDERRARIKGLIAFLRFLGQKQTLYTTGGADETTVPFDLTGNRPIIKLKVNDRDEPLRFVLDTGSGISVISDKTAERLRIKPITRGGFAKGLGGDGRFEIVYGFLREVAIGDVRIKSVPVYIRKFHADADPIDGYIGLSLISNFLTTIDYGKQTFALKKPEGEARQDDNGISLPLRLTSSGFLSGEVKLEGIEAPLNFIVDTGASVSVISQDIAGREGITPYAQTERMRVIGSAGITDDVPSFLLPRVSFGRHSRSSITAIALDLDMINEASGFEQAGILGGNFLKNYRMTFDFRKSKVTFVPISQEP
jgi:tetratricopeptide (TPR) repeat protein